MTHTDHDSIAVLSAEVERLKLENAELRRRLGETAQDEPKSKRGAEDSAEPAAAVPPAAGAIRHESSVADKVSLFRALFRGREDVYAHRWENMGKSGYAPHCANPWDRPKKPGEEDRRRFYPVSDEIVVAHLSGKEILGVYPLLVDDRCWFLAADFDKKDWQADVAAFRETCAVNGVPVAVERSRSGNGAHAWILFQEPIRADTARKLGAVLLTKAMETRLGLGMDSYDRLFPNQDVMPRGGFGNLIALPLQKQARSAGNSVFVNEHFVPYDDQWAYLSGIARMSEQQVDERVFKLSSVSGILGVRLPGGDDSHFLKPWDTPPSGLRAPAIDRSALPKRLQVVLADMTYVETTSVPSLLKNRIARLASFQNPEFYKAQAMRLSVHDKPRVISCFEEHPNHLAIPRGCLPELRTLCAELDLEINLKDKRTKGKAIHIAFRGRLRDDQEVAIAALKRHTSGVLAANTAFGKTVVAIWMIAHRQRNTLILVHRSQLADQWRERLATFLDLDPKQIGQFGGGKKNLGGIVDVAAIQSLCRKGVVKDFVADYGQIIVDECHHISAFSFEQVMRKVKARYVLGLTATPFRKDGHHPIIFMQCGPIRHRVCEREQAAIRPFHHVAEIRRTATSKPPDDAMPIQRLYDRLSTDPKRNQLIVDDVIAASNAGRQALVLSERIDHCELLALELKKHVENVFVLRGGRSKRKAADMLHAAAQVPIDQARVLVASSRYVGEGFDDNRLDTLFLALPISWKGTLQQYAGRLHRNDANKRVVTVYDYLDAEIPVLMRMYKRRLRGYAAMGYSVNDPISDWR